MIERTPGAGTVWMPSGWSPPSSSPQVWGHLQLPGLSYTQQREAVTSLLETLLPLLTLSPPVVGDSFSYLTPHLEASVNRTPKSHQGDVKPCVPHSGCVGTHM